MKESWADYSAKKNAVYTVGKNKDKQMLEVVESGLKNRPALPCPQGKPVPGAHWISLRAAYSQHAPCPSTLWTLLRAYVCSNTPNLKALSSGPDLQSGSIPWELSWIFVRDVWRLHGASSPPTSARQLRWVFGCASRLHVAYIACGASTRRSTRFTLTEHAPWFEPPGLSFLQDHPRLPHPTMKSWNTSPQHREYASLGPWWIVPWPHIRLSVMHATTMHYTLL